MSYVQKAVIPLLSALFASDVFSSMVVRVVRFIVSLLAVIVVHICVWNFAVKMCEAKIYEGRALFTEMPSLEVISRQSKMSAEKQAG